MGFKHIHESSVGGSHGKQKAKSPTDRATSISTTR